jgi:microcystin-dependent protein
VASLSSILLQERNIMAINLSLRDIGSGYNRTTINQNFASIEAALADGVSRSGTTPNTMSADFDLNNNDLLNVADGRFTRIFVDGTEITTESMSRGYAGWSPNFAIVSDSARRVLQLTSWIGGEGDAPTTGVGQYLGPSGFTSTIGDATDIRGPQGASGPGSGDLLASQNLNDLASKPTAFSNIIQVASTAEVVARSSAVKVLTPSNITSVVPLGIVLDYTGLTAPTGWVFPYGQAISRTTYADYFALVGTTFGVGNGSTTFNVPDLRGRVVAGQDDMGGTSANRLTGQSGGVDGDTFGAAGGAETHTLTIAQLAKHGHPWIYSYVNDFDGGNYGGWVMEQTGLEIWPAWNGVPNPNAGRQIGGSGEDSPHNNVQPTIILNKILFVGA